MNNLDEWAPGRMVRVVRDSGEVEVRAIKYPPWQLGHGAWVVGLRGISGGYALERCTLMEAD